MATQTVIGVFHSVLAAQQAKTGLLEAGLHDNQIVLSADMSKDDIAAEAPGQSFDNQPGQAGHDSARHGEAARGGACILTVQTQSQASGKHIERLLRQEGALRTTKQRAQRP